MELVNGPERDRQTVRVGQVILFVTLLSLVPTLIVAISSGLWQWYALGGVLGGVFIVGIAGVYWAQSKRATLGAILLLGSIMFSILVVSFLFAGIGVPLGLLSIFLVWQIANATLATSRASQAVFWGLLFTVIIILLDLFGPDFRLVIPRLINILNWLALVVIVLFGVLVLRNYRHYAVQTKLVSIALFIILLIVSSITVLTGRAIENTLTEEIGGDLQVLAQAQAFAVSELLGRQVNSLQVLALNDVLQTAVSEQNAERLADGEVADQRLIALDEQWKAAPDNDPFVQSVQQTDSALKLRQFQQSFDIHKELFITDSYGGLVGATNRTTDYYQADEAWWQAAYAEGAGDVYISEPLLDESSNAFGLIVALPIYDSSNGDLVGILRTTYALDELFELLNESRRMAEFGSVTLIVEEQRLINADNRFALADTSLDLELLAALRQDEAAFLRGNYLNESQFLSMADISTLSHVPAVDELGWWVLAHQPESQALEPLVVQQRINTLLGILLAMAGGLIAAYAGRVLSEPITKLTETAVRVRNGDLSARAVVDVNDEIGILAETFNSMTAQLQSSLQHLDFRVRERTRALEVAASIGRRIATILDQDELATAVVEEVQKAFNYYHVHIYILDNHTNRLVLVNGTGQAGRSMRKFRHYVNLGEGLVGLAAATNITILAPDVARDPRWLPNKWLPETKSELAVPIATEQEVLGVLDVQRTTAGSLTESDANVLQLVANQVAIALQNSRLYALTQRRADWQSRINTIGQEIQSTDTIEEAMQVAVRELGRVLQMDYARVQLQVEPDTVNGTGLLEDDLENGR
ncbi:MAG: GAF domain-containing protein [Chloroflexota bacterium]